MGKVSAKERKWWQRKGVRSEVSGWHKSHFLGLRPVILRSAATKNLLLPVRQKADPSLYSGWHEGQMKD
jgi:hypothetical protein